MPKKNSHFEGDDLKRGSDGRLYLNDEELGATLMEYKSSGDSPVSIVTDDSGKTFNGDGTAVTFNLPAASSVSPTAVRRYSFLTYGGVFTINADGTDKIHIGTINGSGKSTVLSVLGEYSTLTIVEGGAGGMWFVTSSSGTWDTDSIYYTGLIPTGLISPFGGSSAPATWLLCDGSAVNRTTYAALFAIIGTTYGIGDGAITFNVPNLTEQRTTVGKGAADSLGDTGGAKTHTLLVSEMPAHTHEYQYTPHSGDDGDPSGSGDPTTSYPLDTTSTGGGDPHENMPPYLVVNYIIKT